MPLRLLSIIAYAITPCRHVDTRYYAVACCQDTPFIQLIALRHAIHFTVTFALLITLPRYYAGFHISIAADTACAVMPPISAAITLLLRDDADVWPPPPVIRRYMH